MNPTRITRSDELIALRLCEIARAIQQYERDDRPADFHNWTSGDFLAAAELETKLNKRIHG